jgi:hypothetical protein
MEKVLIQGEMLQIVTGKTPLRLGWLLFCSLIFCKKTQKAAPKLLWTACKHTTKALGKDDFALLRGIM